MVWKIEVEHFISGERAELEGLILNAKTISVHLDTISGPSAISNAEAKENMETIQELYTVLEESEALLKEFTVFEAEHENEEVKIMEIEEAHVAEKSTQKSTDSFVPGTIEWKTSNFQGN